MLLEHETSLKLYLYSPIRSLILGGTIPGNPPLWFIPSLFVTQCLFAFMRDRKLHYAIRCSMENFGKFDYVDNEANGEVRHVRICPMYAVAKIEELKQGIEK